MVNKCLDFIHSLLYPASCLLCGTEGDGGLDLCRECLQGLPVNNHCCARCSAPLFPVVGRDLICGGCVDKPPPFDRCLAPFLYQPPLDSLISGFKFHQKLVNGRLLGQLLLEFLERQRAEMPDLLIPIPLHDRRLAERGFNQSLELARGLSAHFHLPLDFTSCLRIQATAAQMTLTRARRLRNMRGAFRLRGRIKGRHLVLLDDVVTTGATVSELARLLKRQGAERVDVWALARTP